MVTQRWQTRAFAELNAPLGDVVAGQAKLFEALRIAVGAGVLAHDVLDGFNEVRDVGHRSGSFLVKGSFEFTDRGEIGSFSAKKIDDFGRGAKGRQRSDFEDVH